MAFLSQQNVNSDPKVAFFCGEISSLKSSDNGISVKFVSNNFIWIHPTAGYTAVYEKVRGPAVCRLPPAVCRLPPAACRLSITHRNLLLQDKLAG
jgi:hypothetical protein